MLWSCVVQYSSKIMRYNLKGSVSCFYYSICVYNHWQNAERVYIGEEITLKKQKEVEIPIP